MDVDKQKCERVSLFHGNYNTHVAYTLNDKDAFRETMITIQGASNGKLPQSIVYFMECVLEIETKTVLQELYRGGKLTSFDIAKAMEDSGEAANHGCVEDYLSRVLL